MILVSINLPPPTPQGKYFKGKHESQSGSQLERQLTLKGNQIAGLLKIALDILTIFMPQS